MSKNIGNIIGKGRIHDGRYRITETGKNVRVDVWAHDGYGFDVYKVKGVSRDHYDDGQIGNLIRQKADHLAAINAMMRRFGVERMAPIVPPVTPSSIPVAQRPTLQTASPKPRRFLSKYKV